MKMPCPFCGEKVHRKKLEKHVSKAHGQERLKYVRRKLATKKFKCFEECIKCCIRENMPIAVSIWDLKRISDYLGIKISEVFREYCEINTIHHPRNECEFIPIISLYAPCKFLKNKKCSIYDVRPLSCQTFPYGLKETAIYYAGLGYKCIDEGCLIFAQDEIEELEKIDRKGFLEHPITAEYFFYETYLIELNGNDIETITSKLEKTFGWSFEIRIKVPENMIVTKSEKEYGIEDEDKINCIIREIARKKVIENVGTDFSQKIEELDDMSESQMAYLKDMLLDGR